MSWILLVGILGLLVGSFLNVCIYRIPKKESIVWPGSHCQQCGSAVKSYDNIPVISYLLLRGRCRSCQARISPRYPLIELLTALIGLSLLAAYGPTLTALIYFIFCCALLVVTFIDLDYMIIPDAISLGGIVVGLALVYFLPLSYKDAIIGLALGGGGLLAVFYAYYFATGREGMGGGDVKLLGMMGVFIGWRGVLFTIFVASLVGSVIGLIWIAIKGKDMKAALPFGPFLALGAYVYLLFGERLIEIYFNWLGPTL